MNNEITQEKKNEIAGYIRAGLAQPNTVECTSSYVSIGHHQPGIGRMFTCCAWGLGLAGKLGSAEIARERLLNYTALATDFLTSEFGVDLCFFRKVESLHIDKVPAIEIARRLEEGLI